MQSTEEMQAEGLKREIKMISLAKMGALASELGLVLVRDDEMELATEFARFVGVLHLRLAELDAENHAAFETFLGAAAEVDQLEAMLQAGGDELEAGS